jgi:exopolysaccharide biosynthesis polyprenyl glycosylphosphotransferase
VKTLVQWKRATSPDVIRYERRFRLSFSERKLLLLFMDLLLINGALLTFLALRSNYLFTSASPWLPLTWFLLLSIVWLVIALLWDVYDLALAASPMHSLWSSGSAALAAASIYLFIPLITPPFPERRIEVILFPLGATAAIALWRMIYASVFSQPSFTQRALVVGAGWSGQTLAQALADATSLQGNPYQGTGYRIIGFVDDDPVKRGAVVEGIPVLGNRYNLVQIAKEYRPDEVIVAIINTERIHGELFQAILDCRELGIPIVTMTNLYERLTGRVPVEHAGRQFYVVMPLDPPVFQRPYLLLRRFFDLWIGVLGCIAVVAIAPILWLINQLTSPGPLFYRQERVGQGGHPFSIIKFRSMIVDAEKVTGAVWAQDKDSRITKAGRFLRKTRLDELPQFLNILKGEMSLIGPRPERPEFVQHLSEEIPFYRVRHAVKPGLTGWAQVKYRYGASKDDSLIKLQYDLYYIKNEGPFLDMLILFKTVRVVLGFKGR